MKLLRRGDGLPRPFLRMNQTSLNSDIGKLALLSDRLRKTREHLGLSQRELNRRCGFAEHTIYQYEAGRSAPSSEHLKIIAQQLNVSTDYLLELSLDPLKPGDCDLNDDERNMVDVLRREGWLAVIRFCTERAAISQPSPLAPLPKERGTKINDSKE